MIHIELQQLSKQLGGESVLDDLNLQLEGGQIIALLGANGAGKTTLLHLLAGLYQPSAGKILLDGEELQRDRLDQRRRLHYLPDIPTLSPSMTPIDYIVYAVEAYGLSSAANDRRIFELLSEFDILPVADAPCRALSRGQRYKATLVALLAVNPEFWILDEPFTSGMDPLGLTAMRKNMARARDQGRLIIYSTQLVEIAQQTSDSVCVLSSNKIAAFGSPHSLKQSAEHSPGLNALLEQLQASSDRGASQSSDPKTPA